MYDMNNTQPRMYDPDVNHSNRTDPTVREID